jgi:hypothetical protein
MDNLRATLEAAIPATPPTTPREDGEGEVQGKKVKTSTAAWLRVKEILPLLEPSCDGETILKGIAQLEEILSPLSAASGSVPLPLSPPPPND